jgi:hypothetical protein
LRHWLSHRLGLPRVRHGLRRLVVIGADGMVSLAALRWLGRSRRVFCHAR